MGGYGGGYDGYPGESHDRVIYLLCDKPSTALHQTTKRRHTRGGRR